MNAAETLIAQVPRWAASRVGLAAVALVGSWAICQANRGAARPDSDVDLVLLAEDPAAWRTGAGWAEAFGDVERAGWEDWGAVQSLRVVYRGGLEVEWGVAAVAWAATDPLDAGTARVVRDGLKILYDPAGILAKLQAAVKGAEDGGD